MESPFLSALPCASAGQLSIVYLSRESIVPLVLEDPQVSGRTDGYAEGATFNSRFGSFPHATMLGRPWGSQVRASEVDTGSRGKKRKRTRADEGPDPVTTNTHPPDDDDDDGEMTVVKQATTASSGFVYLLKPTPELWTQSLPHRTQVVYTPDYSYVLQRIRAFPGKRLIEAGAGSGSFTHASSRAVFSGGRSTAKTASSHGHDDSAGHVFSYEFHQIRYEKMRLELASHGLDSLVTLTHRDVCGDGFLVDGASPRANAIFLDLPAPWEALPHLSRRRPTSYLRRLAKSSGRREEEGGGAEDAALAESEWVSPLDPRETVYLCTFSPCIEQVTRTVEAMRQLGWVDIDMVEVNHRKLVVQRERVGLGLGHDKGVVVSAANVEEALRKLETSPSNQPDNRAAEDDDDDRAEGDDVEDVNMDNNNSKPESQPAESPQRVSTSAPWRDGHLVHKPDGELKTHTSYLVFAVLPREWSADEEAAAAARWPCGTEQGVVGKLDKARRKEERREAWKKKKRVVMGL